MGAFFRIKLAETYAKNKKKAGAGRQRRRLLKKSKSGDYRAGILISIRSVISSSFSARRVRRLRWARRAWTWVGPM